jgi:GT2 family glycosyltransferase
MTQAETRMAEASGSARATRPPSVLVVLVAKDGASWLRQCLLALSKQTHPRLGVLAVDNGSTDASVELLEQALGADRVTRLDRNPGFATAVASATSTEAAHEADYLLLLHDDAVLAPEAIARMVEAAERIDGVGIVGPKILDWEEPRLLREIGMSSDRFGYPYSPLEDGEIDQGQYDRVREVLFVSSCAMLVSKEAWGRIGLPDERIDSAHEDLDFCWRARIAGFRVLMTPAAEARHRGASGRGDRHGSRQGTRGRYERERGSLVSILKNYRLVSLLWILPLHAIQGLARLAVFTASRRFGDAYQVVAAWGWNVINLPGTLARRFRAQRGRKVSDREVRRYMAPAGERLRRWAALARQALIPPRAEPELGDEEGEMALRVPVRVQLGRLALAHPAGAAWLLAGVLAAISYRNLFGTSLLEGGALARFPAAPTDFFRELGSGLRHTGLGGTQAASPAVGILGVASVIAFGSPALLQKLLLLGLPAVAGVTCYRAVRAATQRGAPAVVAALCYSLSAVLLWSVSEGRIPALVFLAGLPWLATKLREAFDSTVPTRPLRWVAGAGLGLAVLASFFPGALLAGALVAVWAAAVAPGRPARARGLVLSVGALATAALLALPVTIGVIASNGGLMADRVGAPSFFSILRLSFGRGPGAWVVAAFLPVGAALSLVFVRSGARLARWAVLAAVSSVYLAWLGGAGYLPAVLSNPIAFVGLAAFCCSMLVGLGLSSLATGVERQAFGLQQVGGAAVVLVLGLGLLAQAGDVANAGWMVGGAERLPLAYPLVGHPGAAGYRVLWLGPWSSGALPPPAGTPKRRVPAGDASIAYSVTGPGGEEITDVGRPSAGVGYEALDRSLTDILAGQTRHGGALLSTFGIRFVVARSGSLTPQAVRRLHSQLDLDRVPGGDLILFRNPGSAPLASIVPGPEWRSAAGGSGFATLASLPPPTGAARLPLDLDKPVRASDGLLFLSQQYDGRWRLEGEGRRPATKPGRAFGWAVGFPVTEADGSVRLRFGGQTARDVELALVAVLWLAALWITRRPSRG